MKEIRTELTTLEEQKSYAKYFNQTIVSPNPELMQIFKKGPMDPSKALIPESLNVLLKDGYSEVETGYWKWTRRYSNFISKARRIRL